MPKTKAYRKTKAAFKQQYGNKRGETTFYKYRNKYRGTKRVRGLG